jgi:beta-galactosidase
MRARIIFLTVLLLAGRGAFSQQTVSLNGTWRFALAKTKDDAGQLAKFISDTTVFSRFKPTPVPSNWAVLGYEEPVYRGFVNDEASEGFYLRDFNVPAAWQGKNITLHFGGVWSSAEVWLNGKRLGMHYGGFTSFAFPVGDVIKTGEPNRLAVRVRQVADDYKFDVNDDWTLGGIYRDVSLEAMPAKRWIDRVDVKTTFDKQYQDANLIIHTMVIDKHKETLPGNYPSPGEPYQLRYILFSKEGQEIMRKSVLVQAHTATGREDAEVLRVKVPRHWTAETPYCYTLRVELLEKNAVAHTWTGKIGFRQISTEGGVFRINGQAVKLRGVNRHDEHPDVGRATTRAQWLEDITLMKAANINYVRMAHYAHAKGFIELCDSLGMYVGEEVSLGGAGNLMDDPSYSAATFTRCYETVIRDLNNPSIIYWSVGNEDALTELHLAAVKFVKALDPTRPVLLPWRAEESLPEEIDILAPHYWQPKEYDSLASRAGRPIITTEYTHSFGNGGFGGLEDRWKALTSHPAGAGAAIWMWADQGIKTPVALPKASGLSNGDPYLRIDEAGWDGIVDSYRHFTRDYWETKAVYAQVYPAVGEAAFTPGQLSVNIPVKNDFDFTNLAAVTISWSIREDERELASGTGKLAGLPHTTALFKLPLAKLTAVRAGKTYYAWLIFSDAAGNEINRKAVELLPRGVRPVKERSPAAKLTVIKTEGVTVKAGEVSYRFNPESGQLAEAALAGKPLISDLRPTIWRMPDMHETSVIGKVNLRGAADLSRYTPSVLAWDVQETAASVVITAKVNYLIDSSNRFTADYRYTIGTDGNLDVHYEILPKVAIPAVPLVGMIVRTAPGLGDDLRYLGLGPYNAYPNKRSAPILGVWRDTSARVENTGTKAMRWVEAAGPAGVVRIRNKGYLEHNASKAETISILSGILGRPEKGRKPDEPVPQLRTDTGKPFSGEFSIVLLKNRND